MKIRILDIVCNWLILITIPFFILVLIMDTFKSFSSPEDYKYIQYQENWIEEGFMFYVLRNIIMVIVSAFFWLSAWNKLRNRGIFWRRIYYFFWMLMLLGITYNLIVKGIDF